MDLGGGSSYNRPTGPVDRPGLGGHLLSHIGSFAGAFMFWFACGTTSNVHKELSGNQDGSRPVTFQSCLLVKSSTFFKQNLSGLCSGFKSRAGSAAHIHFGSIASSTMRNILKEFEKLQSVPVLSLAAAMVPPFENMSPGVFAVPWENTDVRINGHMDPLCICKNGGSANPSFQEMDWKRQAVEPETGIEFPTVLSDVLSGESNPNLTSEILVGTGSRSMRIIKIKSLSVYAFGLYVRPNNICEKLGGKYASVPVGELNNRPEFFEDLLRADIHMTVRLVVNCKGLKINSVRDTFEKALRARLVKMNPNTDYVCLKTFGSYFTQDIPLPAGTTIEIQQTSDGQLITQIGGKHIGAVDSKDLCRAFFDMYVGDVPVSVQTKEEIARNVASIIKRC